MSLFSEALTIISTPRRAAAFLGLASAAVLGAALFFQYVVGLAPCHLCILQRIPFVVVMVLSVLVWLLHDRPALARSLLGLAGLSLLVGSGIAMFHVGVEQGWWAGTDSCGGAGGGAKTLEELRAQIMAAPVVRCGDVAWSLFGLSMAAYNVLISLGLALAAGLAAARRHKIPAIMAHR